MLLLFILMLLVVLGGAVTYMARRSIALCPPLKGHRKKVWSFFVLSILLMFLVPLLHALTGHRVNLLFWLSYGLFSFVSTYLPFLLVADLVRLLLKGVLKPSKTRDLRVFQATLGTTVVAVVAGAVFALKAPVLRHVEIPVANLPAGLDGFRIVQISDLHLGPLVSHRAVAALVAHTQALNPDLIAVTGDLVDGEADGVRSKAERMGTLQATHGVFFVTGNHEYFSGVDRWMPVIQGMGWHVLDNSHRLIEHHGEPLALVGMPDPAAKSPRHGRTGPDLNRALAGLPSGVPKVLLFHPPTGFAQAERAGITLQLSGHTHSGQYFPWSLLVPLLFEYPKGLHRHGGMWIYTSVGTGFWGPPNRLLMPPELAVLTLKRR